MTTPVLEQAIPTGATILLDTSAILAYLSGAEPTSAAAAVILDRMVATGRNPAILSAVTVTATLVRPIRSGSEQAVHLVEAFLEHFPNLRVEPVTIDIARRAAGIRASTAAPTPDALILATGEVVGAAITIGNDVGWARVIERAGLSTALVRLDDHV